jgi:hypothetical protein
MGSQLETVQFWIAHIVFIVAGNALLDFHAFHIRSFNACIGLCMVAFFTFKAFLVLFMGEFGWFLAGGCFQFHALRTCITCYADTAGRQ